MKTDQIIKLVKIFEKFPVDVILTKHLIMAGIDTEEKLVELIKNEPAISQGMKIKLQNNFRDIERNINGYVFNKIPNIFK
jgi:hypothetical protein